MGADGMVQLFLTADSHLDMVQLVKQMEAMGLEPEVLYHEHKVLCSAPLSEVERRIPCLCTAERVFLCLRREALSEEHPLLSKEGEPDYGELQRWVRTADWATAVERMSQLHGRAANPAPADVKLHPAWRWHVDCRRRGPRGSRVRGVDNLAAKQSVRQALHEVLDPLGVEHDSKTPTMTVFVFLSPHVGLLGVPVFQRHIRQGRFPHKGLHHATAWGLALTARLKPGEVVVDPMAGKGISLLEAAAYWPDCVYVGVEVDPEQLGKAYENVAANPEARCELLLGDARCLPLAPGSADVLICDLPYGRQYSEHSSIPELYRSVLRSLSVVLRPGGRAVLITSEEHAQALCDAAVDDTDESSGGDVIPVASTVGAPPRDQRRLGEVASLVDGAAGGAAAAAAAAAATSAESLRGAAVLPFRFGGHKDRQRCALCCFVRGTLSREEAEALFDFKLARGLENSELTWKDLKPSMVPYQPWRSSSVGH
mmetsp:Transcript_42725/g.112719  ORF Transcript_42725/g.112719 Transcript_42725/m.112719 type:complete len:483 (-) Transcript_42725:241-1689(-)